MSRIYTVLSIAIFIICFHSVLSKEAEKPKHPPQHYITLGDKSIAKRNYGEAAEFYSEAISAGGDEVRLLYKRAEANYLRKAFAFVLGDLKKLLHLNINNIRALLLQGKVQLKTGKFSEAQESYKLILNINKNHKEAKAKLHDANEAASMLALAHNSDDDCIKNLGAILRKFSGSSIKLHIQRAECALRKKNTHIAAAEIRTITSSDPRNTNGKYLYAVYMKQMGQVNKAMEQLRSCLRSDPDNKKCRKLFKEIKITSRILNVGEVRFDDGQFKEAIVKYKKYLEMASDPHNYEEILRKICLAHVKARSTDSGALKDCEEAIQKTGGTMKLEALLDRADIYFLTEELDKAEKDIQAANKIQQNHQRVQQMHRKLQNLKRMASRKNYYKILGIPKTASKKEIKKAYRKQALVNHPDRNKEADRKKAEIKMRDVTEAYEILSDDDKRRRYDNGEDVTGQQQGRQQGFQQGGFNPFGDFGGGGQQFHFNFGGFNF